MAGRHSLPRVSCQKAQAERERVLIDRASNMKRLRAKEEGKEERGSTIVDEGRRIVFLCCLVGAVSSLDRQAMSIAIVPMSGDFGYTETVKGSISSIFSLGYTLALPPLGLAQQLSSPRLLLASGVASWSLFTLLTPLAAEQGVSYLLAARFMVGAAEAVTLPTVQTFVSRWIRPQERATALSVLSTCFQVGTITALVAAPKIVSEQGWQQVFTTFGSFGFVWLLFWLSISKDSPPVYMSSEQVSGVKGELETERSKETFEPSTKLPWRQVRTSKSLWSTAAAHAANNWGLYVALAWLPSFFSQNYHMDLSKSSLYSVLPYLAGAVTSLASGWGADKMISQGVELVQARKIFQGIASFGPSLCMTGLAIYGTDNAPEISSALFVASVSLGGASAGGFAASLQDLSTRYSGFLYGVTTFFCSMAGAAGVYATGRILDETSSWPLVFLTTAMIYSIGGAAYLLWYDATPIEDPE